ncbi:MAG: hypothetical protein GX616_15475 [Planctomycetes bacterium]|nr:hypothetical protein [Planctomycetota bacterium]
MRNWIGLLALAVLVCVMGPACPPGGWPEPPCDTTGTYVGTWEGSTDEDTPAEDQQEVVACPLTITLTQDLSAAYPGDHGVTGTVVVNYSCIELPAGILEIPDSVVEVSGLLGDDGKLTLLSGGCGTGACLGLILTGNAVDADDDGMMDSYSGDWGLAIMLAGIQAFGIDGTFQVVPASE